MLVLVNGCPTEQVQISKGLKQGDLLAPYLFLLIVEGMGALMKKAVGLGYLRGSRLRIRKKSYLIFELFTLTYGAIVHQLLTDLKEVEESSN
ncbi:transmembrane protein, putative [Medicago truncatula]|uniref:Transmembrane protein, putative n=1 Tax=Medicago truncatula TaxID=3880 RepID=A0A072VP64_MEDTR|nr:transmembrane protein, putative [Medicago truncatula]